MNLKLLYFWVNTSIFKSNSLGLVNWVLFCGVVEYMLVNWKLLHFGLMPVSLKVTLF